MNEQIQARLEKYPPGIADMFCALRKLMPDSLRETVWAGLPSFYAGDAFIRLIPFKDHINIEAKAVAAHADELAGYKITPKGMLQIFLKQDIPADALKKIFAETLIG